MRARPFTSSRLLSLLVAAGLVATLSVGVAEAASTAKGVKACASASGRLVLLTSKGHCPAKDHKVTLGATGKTGKTGNTGKTGPAGPGEVLNLQAAKGYSGTAVDLGTIGGVELTFTCFGAGPAKVLTASLLSGFNKDFNFNGDALRTSSADTTTTTTSFISGTASGSDPAPILDDPTANTTDSVLDNLAVTLSPTGATGSITEPITITAYVQTTPGTDLCSIEGTAVSAAS